jgi:hypothetical protein
MISRRTFFYVAIVRLDNINILRPDHFKKVVSYSHHNICLYYVIVSTLHFYVQTSQITPNILRPSNVKSLRNMFHIIFMITRRTFFYVTIRRLNNLNDTYILRPPDVQI